MATDRVVNNGMSNSAWYAALTRRIADMRGALGWLDDQHLQAVIEGADRLRSAALEEQNGRRADR
jgi:hypothetical protein